MSISFAFAPAGGARTREFSCVVGWRRDTGLWALGCLAALVALAGCRTLLPQQYEYEEELYLALDGSATLYVNGSVPALIALRGLPLDPNPREPVDRQRVRAFYESPVTRVNAHQHVAPGRAPVRPPAHRCQRRAPSVGGAARSPGPRTASAVPRTSMSTGRWWAPRREAPRPERRPAQRGGAARKSWRSGSHLPSRIRYHDAPSKTVERGNILVWEQSLADRLAGKPLSIEARLDTRVDSLPHALVVRSDDRGGRRHVCRPALLDHAQGPGSIRPRRPPDRGARGRVSHEPECVLRETERAALLAVRQVRRLGRGAPADRLRLPAAPRSAAGAHARSDRGRSRLRRSSCSAAISAARASRRFGEVDPARADLDHRRRHAGRHLRRARVEAARQTRCRSWRSRPIRCGSDRAWAGTWWPKRR